MNIKQMVLEVLLKKTSLKEFEKFIYSLSFEDGKKYFGEEIFIELLEFDYSKNKVNFDLEKIFIKIIDISDFFREHLLILLERFLEKRGDIIKKYEALHSYSSRGFLFLEPFRYPWHGEYPKNAEYVTKIFEETPKLIEDIKSGKYYNFDFDIDFEYDWRYKILPFSLFSRRGMLVYEEK